jgi:hypothetical protein
VAKDPEVTGTVMISYGRRDSAVDSPSQQAGRSSGCSSDSAIAR